MFVWTQYIGYVLGAWLLNRVRLFAALWTNSPPVSPVHGILQARILEWVAMPYIGLYSC